MDEASSEPSKKRNRRIRDQLGLGRTQNLSDSSDEDDSHEKTNKRMRITVEHEQGPSGTGMSMNFNVIDPLNPYQSILRPEMSQPFSQYIEQSVGKDLQSTHAQFSSVYWKNISSGYKHGERSQEPGTTSLLESLLTRRPRPDSSSYHNPISVYPYETDSAGNTGINPNKIFTYNPATSLLLQASTSYDLTQSETKSDADDTLTASSRQPVCENASEVDSKSPLISIEDDDDVIFLKKEVPQPKSDDDDDDVIFLFQGPALEQPGVRDSFGHIASSTTQTQFESSETKISLPKSLKEIARTCSSPKEFCLPEYTPDEIKEIERETRGKRDNPKWVEFRTGCIEADSFKTVAMNSLALGSMTAWHTQEARKLVGEVMNYPKSLTDQRPSGKGEKNSEMEAIAKQTYTKEHMQRCHCRLDVSACGLYLHPKMVFIGSSPSAQVSCRKCGNGLLQIKCQEVDGWEKPTPCNTPYLVKTTSGKDILMRKHAVYTQIQTHLAVTGQPWCDFFLFTKGGSFRERINRRGMDTWQRYAENVKDFFFKCIVPELVNGGIERSILENKKPSSSSFSGPASVAPTCSSVESSQRTISNTAISGPQLVHSRRTAEVSVTLEELSNGEVLPDSLSERARQCGTVQDFRLPRYSQEDIATIEEKTRGQSDNPFWSHYRIGCISASRFKTVVSWKGSKGRGDVLNKVKRVMGYIGPHPNHPNLVWGRNMEPIARQKYIEIQEWKGHKGIQVAECGIFFHPQKTFIGASPDGLVSCRRDCNACRGKDGNGILEIKCPAKDKDHKAKAGNPSYLTVSQSGRIVLSMQHEYYHQVQTQLAVTGRPWCDFFVYKPGGWFLQRIRPRRRKWRFDSLDAEQFFFKYIVPELVDGKLQK